MPEEVVVQKEVPAEGPQSQGDDKFAALLEEIRGLKASVTKPLEEKKPAAQVPQMPERAQGASQQAYVKQLEDYAAAQRREAERLRLSREYGIEPEELEGDFDSPDAMRRAAAMLAMKREIEALKAQVASGRVTTPVVPKADTGGAQADSSEDAQIELARQEVMKGGRTADTRRKLIDLAYQDPTRRGG